MVFVFVFSRITVKSTWVKLRPKPCDYLKDGRTKGEGAGTYLKAFNAALPKLLQTEVI